MYGCNTNEHIGEMIEMFGYSTMEHVSEMIKISLNLTSGFEFDSLEYNCAQ